MCRSTVLMAFALAASVGCAGAQASPPSVAGPSKPDATPNERLLGAWRLVSIETRRPNGEVIHPFYGGHPRGLIVYDRSGWMSVQIVSDPRSTVPTAGSREAFAAAPAAEKAAAVDGYYAYVGTWTADAAAATVTHHIKQSLYPAEWGEEAVRHFVIEGDRLTLTAKAHEMGEDHLRTLVWERARADAP